MDSGFRRNDEPWDLRRESVHDDDVRVAAHIDKKKEAQQVENTFGVQLDGNKQMGRLTRNVFNHNVARRRTDRFNIIIIHAAEQWMEIGALHMRQSREADVITISDEPDDLTNPAHVML